MSGMLYIVPTPVGNLEDMTFRAIHVLQSVSLILAEDTRTSSKLLKHFEINTPTQSYHMHNEHKMVQSIIDRLLAGMDIALISDAGTPGISDPGFLLIREAIAQQIQVQCLPGATAFVPALVVSGFPTDRFIFEGFLPHQKGRMKKLAEILENDSTTILYESPYRVLKLLEQLIASDIGERQLVSVREISKKFETVGRGTAQELLAHFTENEPKGEFVFLIEGKPKVKKKKYENDRQ
ncbi:MAG: 16S rRNA (cytidine(1402)-2'-O)-methyltransferase [Chitinophagales bacterium]|nr:16S rRNA (cytidine(1402)-2'-O)-methyltransferase [Chitinophagales bacterium]